MAVGTPGYMSPEQATAERATDARSDVYALGCVLYEMLAGEPPFSGPNAQTVIARMLTETPRPIHVTRAGVSEGLDTVTLRALARVPADRYATAAEFGEALAGVAAMQLSGVTAAASPRVVAARLPETTAPHSGRSTPIAAIFVLGILIGLGGLFALKSYRGDNAGRGLAVLPFENVGAAEDAYFADGITEEVRGKLAAIPGLRVTARTSSNSYKGSKKTPTEVGPLAVALLVVVIGASLGGPTGYAINPARDLGPRLMHALLPIPNKGSSGWHYAWVPVVAPLIGGVLGGLLGRAVGFV